jgi:hypothetical protein
MRTHGLMLVRDEADILPESIPHYLTWLDGLYVMDLGSTDGSWEILTQLASRDSRLVLHSSRSLIYSEGLRAILFESYRDRFAAGDWIVKADADEFYDVPPAVFAAQSLSARETCVYLQWYFFRLTTIEVDAIERGAISMSEERRRPVAERRRHYKLPSHAEPRLFRYRPTMRWSADNAFPYQAGYVARARIPVRHYPHRDPWQMAARYRLRSAMMALRNLPGASQWRLTDWRRDVLFVDPNTGLAREQNSDGVGLAAVEAHTDGELHYWQPGEALPAMGPLRNHLAPPAVRLAQFAIHAGPLKLFDHLRSGFSREYQPHQLPDAVRQQLSGPVPDPFTPSGAGT